LHTLSTVLAELLLKWPLIRQLRTGADGTGAEAMSEATRALRPKNSEADRSTGITTRIGGAFSGPLPLLLRIAGFRSKRFRTAAAASTLLGSLITRFAWVEAGKTSSRDLRVPLALDGRYAASPRESIRE